MAGHPTFTDIDGGKWVFAVAFSANGKYLVSGGRPGVRVWRVEDGKEVALLPTKGSVACLAVSKDGRWIAAGTWPGKLIVWDANTYEKVCSHWEDDDINGVDFSPDSTRLLVASQNGTAAVWDVAARRPVVHLLPHASPVIAAKYSPRGDHIATATSRSIRVYSSKDGRFLVDIETNITPAYNTGLLWSNDQLFVAFNGRIKQIEAFTGSAISQWQVPGIVWSPHLALPQHRQFIAYVANRTVSFWDTATHTQLALIQHARDIRSIALSPDDQYLAIGGEDGKITIKNLSYITESVSLSRLHHTSQEPEILIDGASLDLWSRDELADADMLLTQAIADSPNPSHHAFASRALIRVRLQQSDAAIEDANESIKTQPSVIGYIAKSLALVGSGKRHEGYRVCDIAFEHYHSTHVTFLLLIKAIIAFMAGEEDDAISRLDDLIATLPPNTICRVVQAYMYFLVGSSRMENGDYNSAIRSFECARAQVRCHDVQSLLVISLITGWKFDDLRMSTRQRLCEALYAVGRTKDAGESLSDMIKAPEGEVYRSRPIAKWVSDFTHRCLSTPESDGDTAPAATQHDEATILHPMANSTTHTALLCEWVKSTLVSGEWKDALVAAITFAIPRFRIYRAICEHLETYDCLVNAVECFHQMNSELIGETITHDERVKWTTDFKRRCSQKLENLGDIATSAKRHDAAISQYSAGLSLGLAPLQDLFIKRSKAYLAKGLSADALNDANKVITLDPSSPWGYERKHAALHMTGDYENAIDAFETMLSKMWQSSNPSVRKHYRRYVNPSRTRATIRTAIEDVIRESPLMLIDTDSGRLLGKSGQASSFESQPIFGELVSSVTTRIDHARIEQKVAEYYRYAMFSHKWEEDEPLFEKVVRIVVYDLEDSPAHDKLKMFCKIVRDAGIRWAWSDTCCINKADHVVLQEALVSMFKWYQGSAMTIVFLLGVLATSQRGALMRSIWNTRAWTFQEYHASKVVQFYTEDWTPYLNLDVFNHKESPVIISEMEQATSVSARSLMLLRPGLDDIREKLRLASMRQTERAEDAAYSLLGIFTLSLPIVYGEGDQALGRLLAQLLTSSGDASILAWTGKSNSFNSCLPANLMAFFPLPTSHIPLAIEGAEKDAITTRLQANFGLAMELYDQLSQLPTPLFVGQRAKLPCITFKLGPVSASRTRPDVFRAQTTTLGVVEIETKEDLSRLGSLYLIHPWIDFLLDRQPVGSAAEIPPGENADDGSPVTDEFSPFARPSNVPSTAPQTRAARFVARLGRPFVGWPGPTPAPRYAASLLPPSSMSQTDKQTRAVELVARLRRPFGALLLTPNLGNVAAFRRVAAESSITVQVEEVTLAVLKKLGDSVRILDVL